jgi:hypothetical protein
MTLLAPALQRYFTDYAHAQRDLSPNTIAAYRDPWRLLIKHVTATTNVPADKLELDMLDAQAVTGTKRAFPGVRSIRPGQSRADEAMSQPLADDHFAILRRVGEVRRVQAGEILFRGAVANATFS